VHFSNELPETYFKGLTAEFRTYSYKRGRKVGWWEKKKGEANEPLDLMVYNLGAAYYLGLHKKSEHGWQVARDRVVPMDGDLFQQLDEQPAPAELAALPAPAAPSHPSISPAATPIEASLQAVEAVEVVQTSAPVASRPPSVVVDGKISIHGLRRGAR
jgi:phage terminase large subunit GpA-like protein